MVSQAKEYYALCVEREDGESEVAIIELGTDERGTVDAIAVYTSPEGPLQQEDLEKWETDYPVAVSIRKVSHEELLYVMQHKNPRQVFIDGREIDGLVFTGMLKHDLGIARLGDPEEE
jgi:hypothetical protein